MATVTKKQQVHEISIKNITADADIQPRNIIDLDVVREYSDAMIEGDEFPPLAVFFDGVTYWLADGFHRYRAAIKAGMAAFRSGCPNRTCGFLIAFGKAPRCSASWRTSAAIATPPDSGSFGEPATTSPRWTAMPTNC